MNAYQYFIFIKGVCHLDKHRLQTGHFQSGHVSLNMLADADLAFNSNAVATHSVTELPSFFSRRASLVSYEKLYIHNMDLKRYN